MPDQKEIDQEETKHFYFEDYQVGDEYTTLSHRFEIQQIIEFAKTWDPQPFHTDEAIAKASHFAGLTACSAHIFSVFCRISQQWTINVKQQAFASLGFDEMRMHQPVYAGDTVHCRVRVEAARKSQSNPDCGVVSVRSVMLNEKGDRVFSILSAFLMQCRDA